MYVIDTSHDNSGQNWSNQQGVLDRILQLKTKNIAGYMTESYLTDGNQKASETDTSAIQHGCSLTDGCLGREKTEKFVMGLYDSL